MAWFDVLLQGKAVKERLALKGKLPNRITGTWLAVEAPDEDSAREIAIELYGRPAFIKQIIPTTYEAVLAKNEYYGNLFHDEERAHKGNR